MGEELFFLLVRSFLWLEIHVWHAPCQTSSRSRWMVLLGTVVIKAGPQKSCSKRLIFVAIVDDYLTTSAAWRYRLALSLPLPPSLSPSVARTGRMSSTAADVLRALPPIRTNKPRAPEPACSSAASSSPSPSPAPDAESVAAAPPPAEEQKQGETGGSEAPRDISVT